MRCTHLIWNLRTHDLQYFVRKKGGKIIIRPMKKLNKACELFFWHEHVIWIECVCVWVSVCHFFCFFLRKVTTATIKKKKEERTNRVSKSNPTKPINSHLPSGLELQFGYRRNKTTTKTQRRKKNLTKNDFVNTFPIEWCSEYMDYKCVLRLLSARIGSGQLLPWIGIIATV